MNEQRLVDLMLKLALLAEQICTPATLLPWLLQRVIISLVHQDLIFLILHSSILPELFSFASLLSSILRRLRHVHMLTCSLVRYFIDALLG